MKGHKGRVMFSRLEKRQIGVMTNTTMDSEQERDWESDVEWSEGILLFEAGNGWEALNPPR